VEAINPEKWHKRINPLAQLGLGEKYLGLEQAEKERLLLGQLLNKFPENPVGWARLGDNRRGYGDLSEAEKAYKRAYSLQPNAMYVVIQLGDLAMLQRDFNQARSYFGRVESKGWSNPEIAFRLAVIESQMGNTDQAMEWLEKALQRGYNDFGSLYENVELSSLKEDSKFKALLMKYQNE
jgi:predicted Zn-dependent protease